jgi:carboxymethylenebutenolidase
VTALQSLSSLHDGFAFGVLSRQPQGERRGGVVILQEIFGLDAYVHADAERWSLAGFEVLAPSMFDRHKPGFTAGHDPQGVAEGRALAQASERDASMGDIAACAAELGRRGRVFLVGYCYGGRLAWEAAAAVPGLAAASSYYGQLAPLASLQPQCPVICHFGRSDPNIDAEANRAALAAIHPDVPVYIYENSGHGFNNEGAPGADPDDAALARHRTLQLFLASS